MITALDIAAIMPRADSSRWAEPLISAMAAAGLSTTKRAAMFLAQIAHESSELTRLEENLNYSKEGLLKTWPNRFDPDMAARCARNPEKIANIVYANRLGNGNAASNDGWNFRGRGPIQITGRANYLACGKALKVDLIAVPSRLLEPVVGARSAVWFFVERANAIPASDAGDIELVTRKINGGLKGLAERIDYYQRALQRLS